MSVAPATVKSSTSEHGVRPVYSMTGFARISARVSGTLGFTLSLKSVNHRFLDLHLRLPSGLDALEMELRRVLKEQLLRGHVELTLQVDRTAQQRGGYNRDVVASYVDAFQAAAPSATGAPVASRHSTNGSSALESKLA